MSERTRIGRKRGDTPTREPRRADIAPLVRDTLASGGQALDAETLSFMQPRFGHDFSQVRIHVDEQAAESAQAVNALAYTVGSDIVFDTGQFVPGTSDGRRLIAHELAHVIQQSSGSVTGVPIADGLMVSEPHDHFEQAAERVADSVLDAASDTMVTPTKVTGSAASDSGVTVQRDDDDDTLPHYYPFQPPSLLAPPGQQSPLSPFNMHLLPGDPTGGGIGYGQPLAPVLPELEQDPRAPSLRLPPQIPQMPSGGPDSGLWSRLGVGIQGRYGEDEKSIAAGLRLNF